MKSFLACKTEIVNRYRAKTEAINAEWHEKLNEAHAEYEKEIAALKNLECVPDIQDKPQKEHAY